jgi:hypothetical protein
VLPEYQDVVVEGIGNVHIAIIVECQTTRFGHLFLECTCVSPSGEEFAGTAEFDDATVVIPPNIDLFLIAHSQGNWTNNQVINRSEVNLRIHKFFNL